MDQIIAENFDWRVITDSVFWECRTCGSLVRQAMLQQHYDWHQIGDVTIKALEIRP